MQLVPMIIEKVSFCFSSFVAVYGEEAQSASETGTQMERERAASFDPCKKEEVSRDGCTLNCLSHECVSECLRADTLPPLSLSTTIAAPWASLPSQARLAWVRLISSCRCESHEVSVCSLALFSASLLSLDKLANKTQICPRM